MRVIPTPLQPLQPLRAKVLSGAARTTLVFLSPTTGRAIPVDRA